MKRRRFFGCLSGSAALLVGTSLAADRPDAPAWKAGAAAIDITPDGPVWLAGYSNDVFGYLGSRRVIIEGGYEGYSSNLCRQPGPWAPTTEERVIGKAYELLRSINH